MVVPKSKTRIQVTLSNEEVEYLDEQAELQFRKRSQLAGFLIKKYLKERGYPVNVSTDNKD